MGTATGVDLTDLDNFVHYGPMLICRGSLNSWDAAFRTIVRRRSPLENQSAWPFVRPDGERSRRRRSDPRTNRRCASCLRALRQFQVGLTGWLPSVGAHFSASVDLVRVQDLAHVPLLWIV